jgi:hypothetical protein
MKGFVAAGLAERDRHGGGWNVQRLGQDGAGGAVGASVFGGILDADAQAGTVSGDRTPLYAGATGFWLDLHGDTDAVGKRAPEYGQSGCQSTVKAGTASTR